MLLFPHKHHKGILVNSRGAAASALTQNNSRVTVLDDPFLLGQTTTTTHDSKDSGINNIDDPPPPPLPAKSGARRPQMPPLNNCPSELPENGGYDWDSLTFQFSTRNRNAASGVVVDHQQNVHSGVPPPQMWRNYRGSGDNGSPRQPPATTNASVSCGGENNSGLCSQIDKILEHSLQNEM